MDTVKALRDYVTHSLEQADHRITQAASKGDTTQSVFWKGKEAAWEEMGRFLNTLTAFEGGGP